MLTQPDIAYFLLKKGLLDPQSLVEGDLAVVDVSRRNSNFRVVREQGPSYLIKQGLGPEREAAVDHEAAVYRLLHSLQGDGIVSLSRCLPKVHLFSPEEHILVLELLKEARHLGDYHRGGCFSTRLAARLGEALGVLHRLTSGWMGADGGGWQGGGGAFMTQDAPWVLSLHRPNLRLYHLASNANLQLIGAVQRFPEFSLHLDALHGEWRPAALVHYDIKWENLLAVRAGRGHGLNLKIVDWELAGLGDPCWDVGSVFGEYLGFWLLSIPITGTDPPDRFLEMARYPLVNMQPAIRCFWQAYVTSMGLDYVTSGQWLLRAVQYAAARLAQTAFEQCQEWVQPTGNALCFLQVSMNIMQRPHEAAAHLLGIPRFGVVASH